MALTLDATLTAYRTLLAANPGQALMQDENNVVFLLGSELVGSYLHEGKVQGDLYDFADPNAWDAEDGCWDGAGDATQKFIDNPRFVQPDDIGLSSTLSALETR